MHFDRGLEQRVELLEADVAALKRLTTPQSISSRVSPPVPRALTEERPEASIPEPRPEPRVREHRDTWGDPDSEASVLGAWLARLGAIAIILGAAFAFKLAIERGLIDPALRVILGVAAGVGFIALGELSRRRDRLSLASALCAAGVVLLYLSILAGLLLYELLPPTVALPLLIMVAAVGGLLACFHSSIALAALSAVGAYLNALLLMEDASEPGFLYAYVAVVSTGFVGLGCFKLWRPINVLALGATWLLFFLSVGAADFATAFMFATLFFVVFAAATFISPLLSGRSPEKADAVLSIPSTLLYVVAATALLELSHPRWSAAFALLLTAIHVGLSYYAFHLFPNHILGWTMRGLAVALLALAIALQFDGLQMSLLWALEGALLAWLASRLEAPRETYLAPAALIILSLAGTGLQLLLSYRPERLLLTGESALIVLQVTVLYVAAHWLRGATRDGQTRAVSVAVAASLLTLTWLTAETIHQVARGGPLEATIPGTHSWIDSPLLGRPTVQFFLSALWSLYASALLATGIALRLRWARLTAVAVFGVVIVKMVTTDLSLLEGLQRTAAFIGLGVLLLVGSFLYSVLRHAISTSLLRDEADPAP